MIEYCLLEKCDYSCDLACDKDVERRVAELKSHTRVWICLAGVHGRSTSTSSRLLRQTVITDPRRIKSVVTSAAIWILEALFQFSERGERGEKKKNEIWAWWSQMAHKVRVVQHAAFLKRDEHQWLRAPKLHTKSSVYMSRRALCQNETNKPHYQSGEKCCCFFLFLICMEDSLITIIRRTLMRQLQTTDESSLMSCTQKKISGKKKKAAITVSLNWPE